MYFRRVSILFCMFRTCLCCFLSKVQVDSQLLSFLFMISSTDKLLLIQIIIRQLFISLIPPGFIYLKLSSEDFMLYLSWKQNLLTATWRVVLTIIICHTSTVHYFFEFFHACFSFDILTEKLVGVKCKVI